MEMKTCVVVGGSGFLGQRLCKRLLEEGYAVRSVSRSGRPRTVREPWCDGVDWIAASLAWKAALDAVRSAHFVFHLASSTIPSTSNVNLAADLEENAVGSVKLLEAASPPTKVIYVSSGGTVYGIARETPIPETHPTDPICSYGIHKLTVEKYLQLFRIIKQLDFVVLRVANLYGETQGSHKPIGAVAHFAESAVRGTPIRIWGDGTVTRDYVHVDDVVNALLAAMRYQGAQTIFNVGSGTGTTLNELVTIFQEHIGSSLVVRHEPSRGFDVPVNILNIQLAARELSWQPTISLVQGVERMLAAGKHKNT
jgi:UDP-glucose 4-epimerase